MSPDKTKPEAEVGQEPNPLVGVENPTLPPQLPPETQEKGEETSASVKKTTRTTKKTAAPKKEAAPKVQEVVQTSATSGPPPWETNPSLGFLPDYAKSLPPGAPISPDVGLRIQQAFHGQLSNCLSKDYSVFQREWNGILAWVHQNIKGAASYGSLTRYASNWNTNPKGHQQWLFLCRLITVSADPSTRGNTQLKISFKEVESFFTPKQTANLFQFYQI